MKRIFSMLFAVLLMASMTACSNSESNSENGKREALQDQNQETEHGQTDSSMVTANTPVEEVADGQVDPTSGQTFYLWEEGNMPAVTEYTENNGSYADDPDFRPTVRTFPVPEGTDVKGAVLICAGGAFQYRSDQYEGTPVAEALSERGYQSFVVDYRLRPYTQEEGALDLARAVRFVRSHADDYGFSEEDIAVMGFSAGGILSGEMLLNFDGTVNGTALDDRYVPDELDQVSADASACGMIYSFYGRLSVASTDVEKFRESDLPPTYFAYGTRDPFVREFEECIDALEEADVPTETHVLEGMPHGLVFLNAGEDKIAGPVDGPVPAGAGIGKAHNPLHMGRVLFQKPDAQGNGPALGIARKNAVKGHPVQFQIFVPAGACHQRQDFGFIKAWPVRHNSMEPPIQKYPEVQAAIIHHSAAVMVAAHKRICHLAGDHFQTNFFCSAH